MKTMNLTKERIEQLAKEVNLDITNINVVQRSENEMNINILTPDYSIILGLDDRLPFAKQEITIGSAKGIGMPEPLSLSEFKRIVVLLKSIDKEN